MENNELSARDIWYLTDHLMRKEARDKRLAYERRKRSRFLKREHKWWKVSQALKVVREDNIAHYKRQQFAWW